MKHFTYDSLLQVTPEQVTQIRQLYDLCDVKKNQDCIAAIKTWLKKETHLANAAPYINDHYIEHMFILSKGSIEATKVRIDKLLTLRGMMPELCLNINVNEFDSLRRTVQYISLPKVNPKDLSKVTISRFLSDDFDDVSLLSIFRYTFLVEDIVRNIDYTTGLSTIVDFTNVPLSFLMKISLILLKKGTSLAMKGYCMSIKGIHIINASAFVDKILFLLKQSVSEKVFGRIHVHQSLDSLHQYISKDILPKEYGGNLFTCADIAESWERALFSDEIKTIISDAQQLVADETKRSSMKFNEEYLGMPGSFKTLSVD